MKVNPATDPAVRRSGIGASDAAKVVGVSRFGDAVGLYMEKVGMTAPLVETAAMRWGNILEEPVAREYAVQTGRRVWRKPDTIRHFEFPFIYCHLDRLAKGKGEDTRVLEVKTAGVYGASDFGEPGTDQVPADYLLQVQHQLGVTGHEVGDLAVLIGGQKFGIYTIERDEALIHDLFLAEVAFWRAHVEQLVPPPLDGGEGSSDYLAAMFPDKGTGIDVDDTLEALGLQYVATNAAIKREEAEKDAIGNRIREAMGTNAKAAGRNLSISYATVITRRTDWPALAKVAKVPDALLAEYTTPTESRRLTVNVKESLA